MTTEIGIVLTLFFLAVVLFSMEWMTVDVVTLTLVVALVMFDVLTPSEALSGFSNEMVIVLASVFVLSGGLVKSGAIDELGSIIKRFPGASERRETGVLLMISAAVSAFFNNSVATAVLMPAALRIARESRISPSRLLMPLAFASILGGTCTLIGTSTNIAGSAMVARLGLEPFSMFEFAGVGLVMAIAGALWLTLIGGQWIPHRAPVDVVGDRADLPYLSAIVAIEGARAVGRPIGDLKLNAMGVEALGVVRDDQRISAHHRRKLQAGDELIVKAPRDGLLRAAAEFGFEIKPDAKFTPQEQQSNEPAMAEAVLLPQSNLIGKTLQSVDLFRRYGATVAAVHRPGRARPANIDNMRLRIGDVLLLRGAREDLERLRGNSNLWGLIEVENKVLSRRQGMIGSGVIAAAILAGASGVLPLSIALVAAVLVFVVARFITMEEAYRFIDWRLLVLIAGMTSFGGAMIKTGAADYLAYLVVAATQPYGLTATMIAFASLTILLTQPMSNAAAALAVLPVAVAAADSLGIEPRSMAILVTLSASLSFITPLEPACLLVYGPGRYRFTDFIRAGLPLTAICLILLLILVPVFWPM